MLWTSTPRISVSTPETCTKIHATHIYTDAQLGGHYQQYIVGDQQCTAQTVQNGGSFNCIVYINSTDFWVKKCQNGMK